MKNAAPATAIAAPLQDGAEAVRLTRQRLKELDRLRDLGFMQCEQLIAATDTIPKDQLFARMTGPRGGMAEFDRFARAIRQIMVLEFELRGLFKAPDRDAPRKLRLVKSDRPGFEPPEKLFDIGDLSDLRGLDALDIRTDYRSGPLDQVVADIRQTLGAEPPPDDPFAPPPERAALSEPKATISRAEPALAKLPSATVKLPEKTVSPAPFTAQQQAAVKSAVLAIRATGGNGFRMPSAKPGRPRHKRGRGPPR